MDNNRIQVVWKLLTNSNEGFFSFFFNKDVSFFSRVLGEDFLFRRFNFIHG